MALARNPNHFVNGGDPLSHFQQTVLKQVADVVVLHMLLRFGKEIGALGELLDMVVTAQVFQNGHPTAIPSASVNAATWIRRNGRLPLRNDLLVMLAITSITSLLLWR